MWRDPIVEEVRQVREEHAARFGYDIRAIYDDLKESERQGGRKVVSLPSKRRAPQTVKEESSDSRTLDLTPSE